MKSIQKFRESLATRKSSLRNAEMNSRLSAGLELLEDRILLTTYFVDSLDDSIAADGQITLREAITAANTNAAVGDATAGDSAGDKIRFDSALQDSTITLTNGEIAITDDLVIDAQDLNVSVNAGGSSRVFNINANDNVTLKGLVLRNGLASEGGAIFSANGLTTLSDLIIVNSQAISPTTGGGAIFNDGGSKLLVLDSNLSNNSSIAATGGGGAIFNDGGIVNVVNTFMRGNTASGSSGSGGAVMSADGIVRLTDTIVRSNGSVRAGGGLELVDGTAVLNNSKFLTNSTGSMVANPGNGGAVHVTGNSSRVIVNGGLIKDNTAALEGGGFWNQSGSAMVIRDAYITGNVASGAGADEGGGGVFNNGGNLVISSTTFDGNVADGASGSGGGVLSTDGFVTITDSWLRRNRANRAGGGIEIIDGALNVDATHFGGANPTDGNVAGPSGSAAPGNGGAVHVTGTSTQVVVEDSVIRNNRAALEGGGLWNQSGSTMAVRRTTLQDNSANGDAADDGGGAIFNNGGTLRVIDATINSNTAEGTSGSGGGIFSTDGRVVVRGSTIIGNSANRAGGGLEIVDGWAILDGVTLGGAATGLGNIAGTNGSANPGNGGGLHVSGSSGTRVVIKGGSVVGNVAASEGGGLWNQAGSTMVVRSGTALSNNLAFGDDSDNGGGAIFNNGGDLYVSDASIVANFALGTSGSGGGIFTSDGTVIVSDTLIDSNTASRAGGGVEVIDGNVRFENVNINANIAGTDASSTPGNGGGVHVSGGNAKLTFVDGFVQNNTAAKEGGGLWNQTGSAMRLNGTVVSANNSLGTDPAAGGGGIFNNGGRLEIRNANVSGNDSESSGGGMFLTDGGTVIVKDSIVNGNVSDDIGGGILNAGDLVVAGTDIIGNVATNNGGGILTSATGQTKVFDSNITGNSPNDRFDV